MKSSHCWMPSPYTMSASIGYTTIYAIGLLFELVEPS